MAGLGTGAAPFRAFLQHLAWLAQKGEEIGPVYYYFGSRYQGAEYLYGEEIEAFVLDGVITRAGLAFSRDGKKKVYIQHKMLEDSEALAKMLHDDEGVFYLCGPTWPVPDVYEALVNALVKYKGSDPMKAGAYLESLKEDERYVLEVAITSSPPIARLLTRMDRHRSIKFNGRMVELYIPEALADRKGMRVLISWFYISKMLQPSCCEREAVVNFFHKYNYKK